MPQERHFYSPRSLNFPPVCSWCAETSEEAFVGGTAYESREGKKMHPLCSSCAALGQPPQFFGKKDQTSVRSSRNSGDLSHKIKKI
jgi:hypothetical protein